MSPSTGRLKGGPDATRPINDGELPPIRCGLPPGRTLRAPSTDVPGNAPLSDWDLKMRLNDPIARLDCLRSRLAGPA